jgi:hypothetical protein
LPFSMPIDFEDVDHQLVAREPRLHLHRAVERLEETQIVRNRGVVNDVDRIDECRRWWICRLREGIKLDAFAVVDGFGDIGIAATLEPTRILPPRTGRKATPRGLPSRSRPPLRRHHLTDQRSTSSRGSNGLFR